MGASGYVGGELLRLLLWHPAVQVAQSTSARNVGRYLHQVHPNQVSTWKRQAMDGLGEVFSSGAEAARRDHEAEIKELHAKIGQLTVERDFLAGGLKR